VLFPATLRTPRPKRLVCYLLLSACLSCLFQPRRWRCRAGLLCTCLCLRHARSLHVRWRAVCRVSDGTAFGLRRTSFDSRNCLLSLDASLNAGRTCGARPSIPADSLLPAIPCRWRRDVTFPCIRPLDEHMVMRAMFSCTFHSEPSDDGVLLRNLCWRTAPWVLGVQTCEQANFSLVSGLYAGHRTLWTYRSCQAADGGWLYARATVLLHSGRTRRRALPRVYVALTGVRGVCILRCRCPLPALCPATTVRTRAAFLFLPPFSILFVQACGANAGGTGSGQHFATFANGISGERRAGGNGGGAADTTAATSRPALLPGYKPTARQLPGRGDLLARRRTGGAAAHCSFTLPPPLSRPPFSPFSIPCLLVTLSCLCSFSLGLEG